MKNIEVAVIGSGVWGTAMAGLMADKDYDVRSWEFNKETAAFLQQNRTHPMLPFYTLSDGVSIFTELKNAVRNPDIIIIAIDSRFIRSTVREIRKLLDGKIMPYIITLSKGIEADTFKTVCQIVEEELPGSEAKAMIMTGPSFAVEVAAAAPTKVVLAGKDIYSVREAAKLIEGGPLKIETSDDRLGAELGGSLKNAYAVGSGIIDGLSRAAKNSEAAFLIESAKELCRIITTLGGKQETAWGLTGIGDLLLTATSAKSRNFRFGKELGKGLSPDQAQKKINTVVEGREAIKNIYALCLANHIEAPVISSIYGILYDNKEPVSILKAAGFSDDVTNSKVI